MENNNTKLVEKIKVTVDINNGGVAGSKATLFINGDRDNVTVEYLYSSMVPAKTMTLSRSEVVNLNGMLSRYLAVTK